jgi:hypothetical protein
VKPASGAGMSIAERRRLKKLKKKGLTDDEIARELESQQKQQQQQQQSKPAAAVEEKPVAEPSKPVRGKHGKLKKIEKKYRHQTPDERAEMERLLHTSSKRPPAPAVGSVSKSAGQGPVVMAEGLAELLEASNKVLSSCHMLLCC